MKVMKWVLAFGFIVTGSAHAAPLCSVGQTHTTSMGAVFKCVNHKSFGNAWEDPNGTVWSRNLGPFTNSGEVINGIINSDATRACSIIGGYLPTKEEYERLQSFFEYDQNGMTAAGFIDLLSLFADMLHNEFYTSSPYGDNMPLSGAWIFIGDFGYLNAKYCGYARLIRCVSR